jgi:hypothetical protein
VDYQDPTEQHLVSILQNLVEKKASPSIIHLVGCVNKNGIGIFTGIVAGNKKSGRGIETIPKERNSQASSIIIRTGQGF